MTKKKPSAAAMRVMLAIQRKDTQKLRPTPGTEKRNRNRALLVDAEFAPLVEAAERINGEMFSGFDEGPFLSPSRYAVIQFRRALTKIITGA